MLCKWLPAVLTFAPQQGIVVAQIKICITKAYWVPSTVGSGVYKCARVGKNRWHLVILWYPSAKEELSSSPSSASSPSRLMMLLFFPRVKSAISVVLFRLSRRTSGLQGHWLLDGLDVCQD